MQKIRPDMDIGKNIQAIRYKNNMTQDQVVANYILWVSPSPKVPMPNWKQIA